ncbi:hypothetical protein BJ165DRAFT_506442 [Panaeolus papilionaceus]|nr:hypothetical protein BJ165DRAFT_506442 [Panaeolus papilionaceus]
MSPMSHPEFSDNLDTSKRAHLTPLTPEMQEAFDIYKFFRRHPPPGRFNSVLYGSTKAKPYRATPMPDDFYRPLPELVGVRSRFIGLHNSPWSIFSGLPFAGVRIDMKINESEFGMTSFRTAHARPTPQQQIIFSYLCQTLYFEKRPASYLTAQIYLCQNQLKSLVGDIIPQHFTAMRSPGKLELCSVLPFRFFCISVSSDMPDMLKAGVIYALSQIHAKGVCLGNVELSNFFIGDNLKIFVCDLTRATAFIPNHEEGIREASPENMLLEMRKLKFLLNYTDSRPTEYSRIVHASNWDRHVRAEFFKQHLDETYHPNIPEVPHHEIRTTLANLYSEHSWFKMLEQRPRMYIPPHYDRTTIYLALGRFSRSIGNNIPAPPPEVEPPDTSTPRYDLRKRKQAPEDEAHSPPIKRHCRDSIPDSTLSECTTPTQHQASSSLQSSKWKHSSLHAGVFPSQPAPATPNLLLLQSLKTIRACNPRSSKIT